MKSLRELCLSIDSGKSFGPERLEVVERAFVEDQRTAMPWYFRVIIGIGAWVASLFFLGAAFALFDFKLDNQAVLGWTGAVLLPIAVIVGRRNLGVFADQASLALSFAAQVMLYIGFVDEHAHPMATAVALSIVLAAILYVVYPNFISRLVTCFAALQVTLVYMYTSDGDPIFGAGRLESDLSQPILFYWGLQLAAFCWCFLKAPRPLYFSPIGYALAASLATWQGENMWRVWEHATVITYANPFAQWFFVHLHGIFTAMALLVVAIWAAGGRAVLREKAPLFVGLAFILVTLIWIGAGIVLFPMLLLLLGFALQDRPMLGLGVALFPTYLTYYYYNLQLDLLAKAGVLIGAGMMLLLLRTALARTVFAEMKEAS